MNAIHVVTGDNLFHDGKEIIVGSRISRIEEPFPLKLLDKRGIPLGDRGIAQSFHMPVAPERIGDDPGMAFQSPLVTLLNGKSKRIK